MAQRIACSVFLALGLAACVRSQQKVADDDLRAYVQECRTVDRVLGARERHRQPGDDPDQVHQKLHL